MGNIFKKIKCNRINIGFIILLLALAITNLLAALMDRDMSGLSNILMLVSIFCFISRKGLSKIKMIKGDFLLCFLFVAYCIGMALMSGYSLTIGSGAVIYSAFLLLLMYALSMNTYWKSENSFVRILFHVSGILSCICAWVLTDGFTELSAHVNSIYSSTGEVIANRLTLSTIPVVSLLTCMVHKSGKLKTLVLKYIYFLLSILCLLITFRRSGVISLIVALALHIVYTFKMTKRFIENKRLLLNIVSVVVMIIMIICLYRIPFIKEGFTDFLDSASQAVLSLFGNNVFGVDESANIRYRIRSQIMKEYNSYDIFQITFGMGYMYRYLDFPLLQSFIDLGILGGVCFLYFQIAIPVRNICSTPISELDEFIKLYSVFGIMECFYSGIPYGYNRYIFLLMVFFFKYSSDNKKISGQRM